MIQVFTVQTEEIIDLDDSQARELIARLCKAEVLLTGEDEASVTWGGDQRAKDGGIDVSVAMSKGTMASGYIPKAICGFQVKAEKFGPAKVRDEVAPRGVLREIIKEIGSQDGAYILVSTRDRCSNSAMVNRVNTINSCISNLKEKPKVDFYDARRVADWVERHPAIVVWLKELLGKPVRGWRPYGPWAYQETSAETIYIVDEKTKIYSPGSSVGSDALTCINRMRGDIRNKRNIRIIGLSGVGKTRLVQAIFDERIHSNEPTPNKINVIYADAGDELMPAPPQLFEQLSDREDCVVVIDNCGGESHNKFVEKIKILGSKISLITIEYDVRDDIPDNTECYRMEGASDALISELLQSKNSNLSITDIDTIIKFSDGNSRVALALSETVHSAGELARLRNEELFERLFYQGKERSEEILKCGEAISLLYSFNFDDSSDNPEIELIAKLADLSIRAFYRCVSDLSSRGLVQARSKWRALLPHAIANRLAARALESIPRTDVLKLIDSYGDRVALSFSRRLGYLHGSQIAKRFAQEWLSPSGRFGNIMGFTSHDEQIFFNIAPVDPDATLLCLQRAGQEKAFYSKNNRMRYVRLIQSLAYFEKDFKSAAKLLIEFALTDTAGTNEKAEDVLLSLFYCALSGTMATPEVRHDLIKELLGSDVPDIRELGVKAVDHALEANYFSHAGLFDFGAHQRSDGWRPLGKEGVFTWFAPIIRLIAFHTEHSGELSDSLKSIFGRRVRELWHYPILHDELELSIISISKRKNWPDGWQAIRMIFNYDLDSQAEPARIKLKNLERLLAPQGLYDNVRSRLLTNEWALLDADEFNSVSSSDSDSKDDFTGRLQKAHDAAVQLGVECSRNLDTLRRLLPEVLFSKSSANIFDFGIGLGSNLLSPEEIFDEIAVHLIAAPSRSVNVIFLRGITKGWHDASPRKCASFLAAALGHPVWQKIYMDIHCCIPLTGSGFDRVLHAVNLGQTPAYQFSYLGSGRSTDVLSVSQIEKILRAISKLQNGRQVALDVLGMVVFCASSRTNRYKNSLRRLCMKLLTELLPETSEEHFASLHRLDDIARFGVDISPPTQEVSELLDMAINVISDELSGYSKRNNAFSIAAAISARHTIIFLDRVYNSPRSEGFASSIRLIRGWYVKEKTIIWDVQAPEISSWCGKDLDRINYIASACRIFEPAEETGEVQLTKVLLCLINSSPNKSSTLHLVLNRFLPNSWMGSLADIITARLPLLDEMNPNNDPGAAAVIAEARKNLEAQRMQIKQREHVETAERLGSFE